MARLALAAFVVVTIWACPAATSPVPVCLPTSGSEDGLEAPTLAVSLAFEQRKWGLAIDPVDGAACPTDVPAVRIRVGPGPFARVEAGGDAVDLDLSADDPADRSPEVSRVALALAATLFRDRPAIVEAALALPIRTAPLRSGPELRPMAHIMAGGGYVVEPGPGVHAGGVEVEAGIALLNERLLFALRSGWQAPAAVGRAAVPATVQAVPLVLTVRGGFRVRPVLIRIGAGLGFRWCRVDASPRARLEGDGRTQTVPQVSGEIEVVGAPWRNLRVALAADVRGFIGGTSYTWSGRDVYPAPRWGVGLSVRVGAVLGGKP